MTMAKTMIIPVFLLLGIISKCCQGLLPPVDPKNFLPDVALDVAIKAAGGKVDANVKVFNVLDFGAKADGTTDSSMGFIRAFKAGCNLRGDAMVVIPEGTFLTGPVLWQGPCFNTNPLIINVQGTVKAHSDMAMFTGGAEDSIEWFTVQSINGLIVTGNGTFDAQGPEAWEKSDCSINDNCIRLPASIQFNRMANVIVRGIKSVDSKGFHVFISNTQNLAVHDMTIVAPDDSPNTDGIHISKSQNISVSNTVIGTGDDCISIIQGCVDITVDKVTCGPGHGISIGSLGHYDNELDVSAITVKNCTLTGTDNGLRIKTYKNCDLSKASRIIYQDIIMNSVKNPILIDQAYGNKKSTEESKVHISDVKYVNVVGTTITAAAVTLLCSAAVPCEGICLADVNLKYVGKELTRVPFSSNCTNAKVTYSGAQSPPPCK